MGLATMGVQRIPQPTFGASGGHAHLRFEFKARLDVWLFARGVEERRLQCSEALKFFEQLDSFHSPFNCLHQLGDH